MTKLAAALVLDRHEIEVAGSEPYVYTGSYASMKILEAKDLQRWSNINTGIPE